MRNYHKLSITEMLPGYIITLSKRFHQELLKQYGGGYESDVDTYRDA